MDFQKYQYHATYSGYYKAIDEAEKWRQRVLLAESKGNRTFASQAQVMYQHYLGQAQKAEIAIKSDFPFFNSNASN